MEKRRTRNYICLSVFCLLSFTLRILERQKYKDLELEDPERDQVGELCVEKQMTCRGRNFGPSTSFRKNVQQIQ